MNYWKCQFCAFEAEHVEDVRQHVKERHPKQWAQYDR